MAENISTVEIPITESSSALHERETYSIIGSGVIGLLVAHELAQQQHNVRVYSHEGKPDADSSSTSINAIGQFLPWLPVSHAAGIMAELDLREIVSVSAAYYEKLAQNPHVTGVMAVENVELLATGASWPADLPRAMQVRETRLDKPVMFPEPDGTELPMDISYHFDTYSINARRTIAYLAEQAELAGVSFERRSLKPEDIENLNGVIVNAAGTGAHEFDPSQEVANYKGHTIVLQPNDPASMPRQAISAEDLILMPREDGTIVCGALYRENPERPVPLEDEATELLGRLDKMIRATAGLVDGLQENLLDNCEILVHSAGYRVEASDGGIRIAPDESNSRLLHAYGFSGIGWSVGPHLAERIARQARVLHKQVSAQ